MWLSRLLLIAALGVLLVPGLRHLCVYLMAAYALVAALSLILGRLACECGERHEHGPAS
jgi:hypothetical protein